MAGLDQIFPEETRVPSFIAGFFAQFTHGGRHRIGLAGVHHATGNLQFHGIRAVPELLDHHDLLIGGNGHDVDPVDAVENKEIVFLAGARRNADVGAQLKDAVIPERR